MNWLWKWEYIQLQSDQRFVVITRCLLTMNSGNIHECKIQSDTYRSRIFHLWNHLQIEWIERITVADFPTGSLPEASAHTNPANGHAKDCAQWSDMTQPEIHAIGGPSLSDLELNYCTAHGDDKMYCMDETKQKKYCRCDHVRQQKYPPERPNWLTT